MDKKIFRAEELPENEEVFLKKDMFGWRVVEPIIHPTTGKFIWKNFLNKKGFVLLIFLLILGGFCWLAFNESINNYNIVMNNPCSFCKDCQEQTREILSGIKNNAQLPTGLGNFSFNIG